MHAYMQAVSDLMINVGIKRSSD